MFIFTVPSPTAQTMKEIARLAGVSQPTVSRALRNDESISQATINRIRLIAEQVGYRPNPLISTLMADLKTKRRSTFVNILAFVIPHPDPKAWCMHPTYVAMRDGAMKRAESLGFHLENFWLQEPGMTSEKFSKMLHTRNINGVLIGLPIQIDPLEINLEWEFFAAAGIGMTMIRPSLSQSSTHHYLDMNLLLSRLESLGYKRIGLVSYFRANSWSCAVWESAYLHFQHALPARQRLKICKGDWNTNTFRDWFKREQPDVLIGHSNELCPWVRGLGIRIPEDVAFVSLNTGFEEAGPAGIHQQHEMVGASAVDLIIGQLHRNERGIPLHPKSVMIKGEWVDGPTLPPRVPKKRVRS